MFVTLGNLNSLISKNRSDRHCIIKIYLLHTEKEFDDVLILVRKGIYRNHWDIKQGYDQK